MSEQNKTPPLPGSHRQATPPPVPLWLISPTEGDANHFGSPPPLPGEVKARASDVSQPPLLPANLRWKVALRVALWGGFGAAAGLALYQATLTMPEWGPFQWSGFVLAMILGGVWRGKIEPAFRVHLFKDDAAQDANRQLALKHTGLGVLFGAGLEVLVELIHEQGRENAPGFLGLLLSSLFNAVAITFFWAVGAQRKSRRSALYGFLAAFFIGAPSSLVIFSTAPQTLPWFSVFVYYVANALFWLAIAFAGGLSIDRSWYKHDVWKIAVYATIAGLAVEMVYMLLTDQTSDVAALFHDVMRGVGWGLGLWLCPAAANAFCSARS